MENPLKAGMKKAPRGGFGQMWGNPIFDARTRLLLQAACPQHRHTAGVPRRSR